MEIKEIIAGTLEWCNQMRKGQGREPLVDLPKGKRYDRQSCPCGEATGLIVGLISFYRQNAEPFSHTELPEIVGEFVTLFDGGNLPQYDIDHE